MKDLRTVLYTEVARTEDSARVVIRIRSNGSGGLETTRWFAFAPEDAERTAHLMLDAVAETRRAEG